jgi:serine/threonine protein kinase
MLLAVGDTFAGYRVLRILGSGGMGEVYLVQHPRLPRRDALKLLRTDISADPDYRSRFEREADLASTLWHPNIVGLHDRGEVGGHLWIAMDFVDGLNTAELMSNRYSRGMPARLVTTIVSAVAAALDYAHKQGLLHRDVKPANIIVTGPDNEGETRVLLADFGIARNIDDVSGLTTTNMTVGTVAYAAPEQLMGEYVDGRADQYALAATTYHLLTGSQLYPHSNPAVVISRHLNTEPPKLAHSRSDLAGFDPALAIALSKNPASRFARCSDFAHALTDQNVATAAHLASAPTQSAPIPPRYPLTGPDISSTNQTKTAVRRRPVLVTAASALTAIAIAVAAWHPWTHKAPPSAAAAAPSAAAAANTGPVTGVYTAEFGPEIELGSGKGLNPDGARGTLQIRSACTPTGCRAIANAITGPTINRSLIFDEVDGQWVSVATAPSTSPQISKGMNAGCEQGLSPEVWEAISLKAQPNGALTGQYEVTDANNCNTSRTIKLTRTGDVDISAIDDPSALPPRKPSPAAGFRGQYRYRHSTASGFTHDVVGSVQTRCLRTVERCMSYFNEVKSAEPFVFADGQWILHYNAPVSCGGPTGPRVRIDRSAALDLPSPASDPLDVVVGHGREEVPSGPCASNHDYDLRFERTGD